jgi:hypothetical protein
MQFYSLLAVSASFLYSLLLHCISFSISFPISFPFFFSFLLACFLYFRPISRYGRLLQMSAELSDKSLLSLSILFTSLVHFLISNSVAAPTFSAGRALKPLVPGLCSSSPAACRTVAHIDRILIRKGWNDLVRRCSPFFLFLPIHKFFTK